MTSVFGRFAGKRNYSHNNNNATANASTTDLQHSNTSSANVATAAAAEEGDDIRGKLQSPSTWNLQQQHHRRDSSILSLTTTNLTDVGANVKRSLSLRSHRTNPSSSSSFAHKARSPGGGNSNFTPLSSASPVETEEDRPPFGSPQKSIKGKSKDKEPSGGAQSQKEAGPLLRRKISLTAKGLSHKFKSTEALPHLNNPAYLDNIAVRSPPNSSVDRNEPSMLVSAAAPNNVPGNRKMSLAPSDISSGRPGLGVHTQSSFAREISSSHGGPTGAPLSHAPSAPSTIGGPLNPNTIYTQIQETSAKRMATIDYIRKLHEGDIFYFSAMHYTQASLSSMPSLYSYKLGRRATNYFILGLSIPTLLDMNSGNALEYLKALSSLLQEFETYQTLSGFDASGNSVSRGRVGQMFKSGIGLGGRGSKGRRSSTTADMMGGSLDPRQAELLGMPGAGRSPLDATSPQEMTSPINPTGHEFSYLLTPHMPFEPDFGTTLSTLCDTLIDTYGKLMDLVSSPDACTPSVGTEFAKADKAIRKILVANVVREFEDSTRAGVKGEMAGLGKLVLGGLM